MSHTPGDARSTCLSRFLHDAGERPFRELVRHHLEHQSATQLRLAASSETSALPKELQPMVAPYLDDLNEHYSYAGSSGRGPRAVMLSIPSWVCATNVLACRLEFL